MISITMLDQRVLRLLDDLGGVLDGRGFKLLPVCAESWSASLRVSRPLWSGSCVGSVSLEPDVRRTRKGQARVLEIVDVVARELDAGQLEEPRPADALDPLAEALELLRRWRRRPPRC